VILLGKELTVTESTNRSLIGLRGTVIEDGRDSIKIREKDGREHLLIKQTITVTVDGHELSTAEIKGTHVQRLKR